MRLRFADSADEQFEAIIDSLIEFSPAAAADLYERVMDAVRRLTEFPHSGRRVPELDEPDLREVIVAPYRIFYVVGEGEIFVTAVWHGAQDVTGEADAG